jgi:hypothetical protein
VQEDEWRPWLCPVPPLDLDSAPEAGCP